MNIMDENICTFVPHLNRGETKILHVVYETTRQLKSNQITLSFYRIHFVFSGEGILHSCGMSKRFEKGDLFVCPPNVPYSIEGDDELKFGFISLVGARVDNTCKKIELASPNVFCGHEDISHIWQSCVNASDESAAILAEGCALLCLGIISEGLLSVNDTVNKGNARSIVKEYIDIHFSNPKLNLESLCREIAYNPKYVSRLFVKEFGTTFSKYLNEVRLNNALALISGGFTSIKEISNLCGYSDPLYFSKQFKAKMGISPRKYIEEKNSDAR